MVLALLIGFGVGDPGGVRLLDKGRAVRLLLELRWQCTRSVGIWHILGSIWACRLARTEDGGAAPGTRVGNIPVNGMASTYASHGMVILGFVTLLSSVCFSS